MNNNDCNIITSLNTLYSYKEFKENEINKIGEMRYYYNVTANDNLYTFEIGKTYTFKNTYHALYNIINNEIDNMIIIPIFYDENDNIININDTNSNPLEIKKVYNNTYDIDNNKLKIIQRKYSIRKLNELNSHKNNLISKKNILISDNSIFLSDSIKCIDKSIKDIENNIKKLEEKINIDTEYYKFISDYKFKIYDGNMSYII